MESNYCNSEESRLALKRQIIEELTQCSIRELKIINLFISVVVNKKDEAK